MIARAIRSTVRGLRWLASTRGDAVSGAWLEAHAATETRVGWDGPRWRTPAERARMAREDRRKAMRRVS